MANSKHTKALNSGINSFNEWRRKNSGVIYGLDISGANFENSNFIGGNLCGAIAKNANLKNSNLRRANLEGADLRNANLSGADLTGANLNGANLSKARLNGACLSSSKLYGANVTGADLSGANMERALLQETNFHSANLYKAKLNSAEVFFTNFKSANLNSVNLSQAELIGVNLSNASLVKTNFRDTSIRDIDFSNLDLSQARGLDQITHSGPSTLGIDTIINSNGDIPEIFLRGCGVPDIFIQYLGSLLHKPIQYYSCFISHSSKDQDFAKRLHADLQANNVRCWFAPEDIQAGKKLHHQIDDAIRVYDRLLLILSKNSMQSEWVNTEISKARKREITQKKQMLFPVRLVDMNTLKTWECFDSDVGKDSAREIREYFIPDFCDWKKDHKKYQSEFKKLLRDLKANSR